MIRRRYRITMEVDVRMNEMTVEQALMDEAARREAWLNRALADGESWHYEPDLPRETDLAAVRALQVELLRNTEVLDRWCRKNVLLDAAEKVQAAADAAEWDRDMLHPVVERLPAWARHWWRQTLYSLDDDALGERIMLLYGSVESEGGPAEVVAIERLE